MAVDNLVPNKTGLSFKCRRCRQYLFGGDAIMANTHSTITSSRQKSVWYLDHEKSPQWVKDSIDKAQWTKGKLNCPKCQGRLGSFDFITPNKNQLMASALYSPIQVIQTRVDCDSPSNGLDGIPGHKNLRLSRYQNGAMFSKATPDISQESKQIPENDCTDVIASFSEATASFRSDDGPVSVQVNTGMSEISCNDQATEPIPETGHGQDLSDSIHSQFAQDACTLEDVDENSSGSSTGQEHDAEVRMRQPSDLRNQPFESSVLREDTFESGASDNYESNHGQFTHQMANESSQNGIEQTCLISSQTLTNPELTNDNLLGELNPQGQSSPQSGSTSLNHSSFNEDIGFHGVSFDGEDSASWEDFFEDIMSEMRGMRTSSSMSNMSSDLNIDNQESSQDMDHTISGTSSSLSGHQSAREKAALRRERNRRKKERRKQRRRERWAESQDDIIDDQDPSLSSLLDVLGTDWSRQSLQEVTTCSICLDVFYQPHSCVPCNHIFCEPCLRQLACVHHVVAPCPLCRTSIRSVTEHYELTAAIKKLFPAQMKRRQEAERRTLHRSYPLPGHSSHFSKPWFTIPRFRSSGTNERVQQFTSRVNRNRQRRQQLQRTFFQELSSEALALLMFFAVFVGVVITFLSLMNEVT